MRLLYCLVIFLNSFLLFLVQPMVGKMLLPYLGGSPAVWNICMLFFQSCLLAGYSYSHLLSCKVQFRWQAVAQIALMLCATIFLPFRVEDLQPDVGEYSAIAWLLKTLFFRIGLPMFVVSSLSTLLQHWYSLKDEESQPYFLYSASNAGSFLALLAYPLLVEPLASLHLQLLSWVYGYWTLVGTTFLLTLITRSKRPLTTMSPSKEPTPNTSSVFYWLFASFLPCSLMLSATSHITTNVAAIPLLWILPLAIYLLTFVIIFSPRWRDSRAVVRFAFPYVLLTISPFIFFEIRGPAWMLIFAHLLLLFFCCMLCHGALAKSRPHATHLTFYYLILALGGVLGGIFNALIAPLIFSQILEYPLALAFCPIFFKEFPFSFSRKTPPYVNSSIFQPTLIFVWLLVASFLLSSYQGELPPYLIALVFGVPALLAFSQKHKPVSFAFCVAFLFIGLSRFADQTGIPLYRERNYFGAKRVVSSYDGRFISFVHGGTNHGSQYRSGEKSCEPLTYFNRKGPIGEAFQLIESSPKAQVAIVGLGVGSVGTYCQETQHFTFYEIDPAVKRIAEDQRFFHFLSDCTRSYDVQLGDGRLQLQTAPDRLYDVIILDAFSSDSIPTHLLTIEAVELYLRKLKENGFLVFHISNRYLDLRPVLFGAAKLQNLEVRFRFDNDQTEEKSSSQYAILYSKRNIPLPLPLAWEPPEPSLRELEWTDQYSSIFPLWRTR